MEKGGTTKYDENQPKSRPVKLSLIVQTTKYFQFLFRTTFVYKVNCRNLIQTSKFKCSFRELGQ